ncbi:excisionase family DNA-binding protein [Amycolatopsis echigonensis]|uniref:excisionase family DNA-binding protein n=1 Tax=Amycolatopsis echigonensis TaxID=2576905 RepID=UPI0028AA73A1|nr:excisionase family DNA-binding protein [Amycolatopsis echigonensis]
MQGNQDKPAVSVGDLAISDAFAHRFATIVGDVVAQRLRELPGGQPRVLLTVEEAADRLAIGRSVVYALLRSRQLESVTIGRTRRVPAAAVDEFVARLRKEQNEPPQ